MLMGCDYYQDEESPKKGFMFGITQRCPDNESAFFLFFFFLEPNATVFTKGSVSK